MSTHPAEPQESTKPTFWKETGIVAGINLVINLVGTGLAFGLIFLAFADLSMSFNDVMDDPEAFSKSLEEVSDDQIVRMLLYMLGAAGVALVFFIVSIVVMYKGLKKRQVPSPGLTMVIGLASGFAVSSVLGFIVPYVGSVVAAGAVWVGMALFANSQVPSPISGNQGNYPPAPQQSSYPPPPAE